MFTLYFVVAGVQSLSWIWLFAAPWTVAHQAPLSSTISHSLLKFMSIELVMLPSHLILGHPLYFLPSAFPSIRIFSKELVLCISWLKYWSFSFSISPSNEYSGLISLQSKTFKSLLQHHNSKASSLCIQPSLRSNSHICMWLLEKP